jgi:uncharacterized protein Yka (UPF0111/DUF47 family)
MRQNCYEIVTGKVVTVSDCLWEESGMFSLRQVFGKDDKFFGLLEAAAQEARHSVQALNRHLAATDGMAALDELVQSRRAEKKIAEEISEALVATFATQLEREDIQMLSEALYKIPKTVEKFAERYAISASLVQGTNFSRHVRLLEAATEQVVEMVKELRDVGAGQLDTVKGMNSKLQGIEGEADELILETLRDLWSGRHDTTRVIVMKDLYELLEKVVDRCRDAGKAVTHIVLKNS